MEKHLAHIPSPKLYAIENRLQRAKYLKAARQYPPRSQDRKIDLDLALMYKRHELSWEVTYIEDYLLAGR